MSIDEFIQALKKIQDKRGDVDVIIEENYWSKFDKGGNGPCTVLSGTYYSEDVTIDDLLPVVNGKIVIESRDVWCD